MNYGIVNFSGREYGNVLKEGAVYAGFIIQARFFSFLAELNTMIFGEGVAFEFAFHIFCVFKDFFCA